ncbi:MAG: helix-turn-helix domain-containing protein [Armatimonadota bacterium]
MSVESTLLDSDEIDLLLHSECWQPVFGDSDEGAVDDPRHDRWLREKPHAHTHPEIMLVVSGGGRHAHGERIFPCRPGSAFFFGPFDAHDAEPAPHLPDARQLWFALHGNRATARMIEVADGRWRRGWALVLPHSQDAIAQWKVAWEACEPDLRKLRLMAVAQLLVATLLEAGDEAARDEDRGGFQRAVVAAICDHIEETAGRGDDLASLARLAGYSKYHFARLFKRETGMTVLEYIDACRLSRTREMVDAGRTYAQMAEELGFSSAQSFSRWYQGRK